MCFIRLIKFIIKFVIPVAIIGLVIWLVYYNVGKKAEDDEPPATTVLTQVLDEGVK